MADQVTTDADARSAKSRPPTLLIVGWVIALLSAGAFGLSLASDSFGAVLTTILLLLATWSAAIFLSLAEMSVRSERRFREKNADRE